MEVAPVGRDRVAKEQHLVGLKAKELEQRPQRAPGGEGNGDSYLDENLHVHERLGQDGETGAQEYLTGRVRHDGTRGPTDRRNHRATEPALGHVPGPPASPARPRRARTHTPAGAAPPSPRPPRRLEKRQALARPGRGLGRMRLVVGSAPSTGKGSLSCACAGRKRREEERAWSWAVGDPESKGKVRRRIIERILPYGSPLCLASAT